MSYPWDNWDSEWEEPTPEEKEQYRMVQEAYEAHDDEPETTQ